MTRGESCAIIESSSTCIGKCSESPYGSPERWPGRQVRLGSGHRNTAPALERDSTRCRVRVSKAGGRGSLISLLVGISPACPAANGATSHTSPTSRPPPNPTRKAMGRDAAISLALAGTRPGSPFSVWGVVSLPVHAELSKGEEPCSICTSFRRVMGIASSSNTPRQRHLDTF